MNADVCGSRTLTVSRADSAALPEDKELARDFTHDGRSLPNRKRLTVICTVVFHSRTSNELELGWTPSATWDKESSMIDGYNR